MGRRVKKHEHYVFPEKNGMIVVFEGNYDMYRNGERGRPKFRILDYKDYPAKYPNDTMCLFDRDIDTLIPVKDHNE